MENKKWPHQKQRNGKDRACPNSALMCPSPLQHAPSHEYEGPEERGEKNNKTNKKQKRQQTSNVTNICAH